MHYFATHQASHDKTNLVKNEKKKNLIKKEFKNRT